MMTSFRAVQAEFPQLTMNLTSKSDPPDVDLAILRQPGLDFDVYAYLQGDELHLTAGRYFWLEWFPRKGESVEADFFDCVRGLLSGRFRIVEYHRRGRAFKAVLERPKNGGWESHGSWMRVHLPFLPADRIVLQNGRGQA